MLNRLSVRSLGLCFYSAQKPVGGWKETKGGKEEESGQLAGSAL